MAVQRRANDAPAEWRSKTAKCYRVYNGAPGGTQAPPFSPGRASWASPFASLDCISREFKREVELYIREAAKVGSRAPGAFWCCCGAEQAKSVVVSWARGRLGRVALSEAAMVVDVASALALRRKSRVASRTSPRWTLPRTNAATASFSEQTAQDAGLLYVRLARSAQRVRGQGANGGGANALCART